MLLDWRLLRQLRLGLYPFSCTHDLGLKVYRVVPRPRTPTAEKLALGSTSLCCGARSSFGLGDRCCVRLEQVLVILPTRESALVFLSAARSASDLDDLFHGLAAFEVENQVGLVQRHEVLAR